MSTSRFDSLILDYELTDDANVVELIRLARSIKHRQHASIVMFS